MMEPEHWSLTGNDNDDKIIYIAPFHGAQCYNV